MVAPFPGIEFARDLAGVIAVGRPHRGGWRQHIFKAARHHADDGEVVAIEFDRVAENRRIGVKEPSPEPVAENHDLWRIRALFRSAEVAAKRRRNSQHMEEPRADALAFQPLWLRAPANRRLPWLENGSRLE